MNRWRVVCQNKECGVSYDQAAQLHADRKDIPRPTKCGACGSDQIATMEHPIITPLSEAAFWAENPYAN